MSLPRSTEFGTGDGYNLANESTPYPVSENATEHKFVCDCTAAAFLESHDVSVTCLLYVIYRERTNRRRLTAFDGCP